MRRRVPRFLAGIGLLVILLAAPPSARARWVAPVDGKVIRAFAVGPDRFAAGQHRGVDLAATLGSAVRSACAGQVSFVGRLPGGGLTVSVRCGLLIATYQHLAAAVVHRGSAVSVRTRLGAVGRSGRPRTSQPHVHLGVREVATGAYVDPMTLFARAWPRLPPPLASPRLRAPPLGPAPTPRRAPRRPRPGPLRAPRVGPARAPGRVKWPAWVGLACVGLGLPIGGFVRLRRRRRATSHVVRPA